MTVFAYLRVSTDEQDTESQKIGVQKKASELNLKIDRWIKDDGVSGVTPTSKRALGQILRCLKTNDILIVSELSRLARDLFLLMEILKVCRDKNVRVFTVKENFEIKDDIQSKTLVFSFGLSAEIERNLLIQRTKEGLERARQEGKHLGRPFGLSYRKLKEKDVVELIDRGFNKTQIAEELGCTWTTLHRFMHEKNIQTPEKEILSIIPNYKTGEVIKSYKRKKNKYELMAEEKGCHYNSVMKWKKQGLSDEEIRVKPFNFNYEKTKEKCYNLGLSFVEFNQLFKKTGSIPETLNKLLKGDINA